MTMASAERGAALPIAKTVGDAGGSSGKDPLETTVDTLIGRLETLSEAPDAKLTCDGLIEVIGPGSHALALLIFSLLNLLPAPPGYNFMVGLVITGLAILMTFGRPLRLWGFIGRRRLPLKGLVKLLGVLRWLTQLVTRISAPRLRVLTSRRALPLIGLFGVAMGLTMLIPIPFTNMLPSIGLAMVSVGVLNRDGLLVSLGVVVGIAGIAVVIFALWLIVALFVAVDAAVDDAEGTE
jgi:hypothetical protein